MIILGVPTYRRYDLLKQMLASVDTGTVVPSHCVIVDNGGHLTNSGHLPTETKMELIVDNPGRNMGVAGGWNRIMYIAHHLIRPDGQPAQELQVLITNDDIVFGPKTIENMIAKMTTAKHMVVAADGGEAFSCFLIDRELYAKVGQFDEQFHPAYFEDNDYVRRMQLVGETFAVAERADGYAHARSSTLKTYNPNEMAEHHRNFEANRTRYITKWGGLPGSEIFTKPGGP